MRLVWLPDATQNDPAKTGSPQEISADNSPWNKPRLQNYAARSKVFRERVAQDKWMIDARANQRNQTAKQASVIALAAELLTGVAVEDPVGAEIP